MGYLFLLIDDHGYFLLVNAFDDSVRLEWIDFIMPSSQHMTRYEIRETLMDDFTETHPFGMIHFQFITLVYC